MENGTSWIELLKLNRANLIKMALDLQNEYKGYIEGWHDDICMRKDGSIYHTGLVTYGTSMDVYNGKAIEVHCIYTATKHTKDELKSDIDCLIDKLEESREYELEQEKIDKIINENMEEEMKELGWGK